MVLISLPLGCLMALVALVPRVFADEPADTTLARLQALELPKVRVREGTRLVVLQHPEFGIDGIRYRKAEGFPHPRPAVFTDADWDSIAPPPNPVPWSAIDGLEREHRGGLSGGGMVMGIAGFTVASGYVGLVTAYGLEWSNGQTIAASLSAGVIGALIGAKIGNALFGPGKTWQPVYAAP